VTFPPTYFAPHSDCWGCSWRRPWTSVGAIRCVADQMPKWVSDVLIPLVVGLGGVFAGIAFNWGRLAFERARRKRTLVVALVAEAMASGISLWHLLHEHPRSENTLEGSRRFWSRVGDYQGAGDLFFDNLSGADVLEPEAIRKLTDGYVDLRAAALEGQRLVEAGNSPMGFTWALKDRLARITGELREAVSLLDASRQRHQRESR